MKNNKIIFSIFIFILLFLFFNEKVYAAGTVNCINNKCSCYYRRKVDGDNHTQYEVTYQPGSSAVAIYNQTGQKEYTSTSISWSNFTLQGNVCPPLYLKTFNQSTSNIIFGGLEGTEDVTYCTNPSNSSTCSFIEFESFDPSTGNSSSAPTTGTLNTKTCRISNCKEWDPNTQMIVDSTKQIVLNLNFQNTQNNYMDSVYFGSDQLTVREIVFIDNTYMDELSRGGECGNYIMYLEEKLYFHNEELPVHGSESVRNERMIFCGGFTNSGLTGSLTDVIELGTSLGCTDIQSTNTYKVIKQVFTWIQIAAPIMLIIFGVLDFGKAVASGEADAMKKSQGAFVKRLIITAIIILLPVIIDLIIGLLEGIINGNLTTCGIAK